MLSIDYTLFIQIANFLVLLLVLNLILYRPIRGILKQRKDEIDSNENMAKDWRERAARFSAELQETIAITRKEGLKEKEGLKNIGLEEEKKILRKVSVSVEEKIIRKREEIQERLGKARQTLQSEVEGFSRELAEKLLGRSL